MTLPQVLFCPNNEAMDTKGMTLSSWTRLIAAHWEVRACWDERK